MNYKIGDKFKDNSGEILEIVSMIKNEYFDIIYEVTYKGERRTLTDLYLMMNCIRI